MTLVFIPFYFRAESPNLQRGFTNGRVSRIQFDLLNEFHLDKFIFVMIIKIACTAMQLHSTQPKQTAS